MRSLIMCLALTGLTVLPGAALADPPDWANNALVIDIDEDACSWSIGDYWGLGTVHYVETSSGVWNLTCMGDLDEESDVPDSAETLKSTDDDPQGYCQTPWDYTADFRIRVTPSGQTSMSCHGDLND